MPDLELKVTAIKELTPSIKLFELVRAVGGELPPFQAGAHIDIRTGNGLIRSYSLANDPTDRDRYVTAVLREPNGGGGSKWMHDELKVGDVVTSSEPLQNFPLNERAPLSILLAGGIGITPIMAMGYRLRAQRLPCHLHYCTKAPEDTAFMDEVKVLYGDNLTLHHDGGDPSKGIDLKETFATPPDGAHAYICGPPGLIRAAQEATAHWPQGTVHVELFTSARTEEETAEIAARAGADQAFEIELTHSGETLTVPADKSILDVLLDSGFGVPYACEEGWCGACVIDLVAGKADHRDEVMSDAEKAANTRIQVCISRALPGEQLVLDL